MKSNAQNFFRNLIAIIYLLLSLSYMVWLAMAIYHELVLNFNAFYLIISLFNPLVYFVFFYFFFCLSSAILYCVGSIRILMKKKDPYSKFYLANCIPMPFFIISYLFLEGMFYSYFGLLFVVASSITTLFLKRTDLSINAELHRD